MSKVDKDVKNARLALQRARDGGLSVAMVAHLERELERALAKKQRAKALQGRGI